MSDNDAYNHAKSTLSRIREFLAAYSLDWERYEELREELAAQGTNGCLWDTETREEYDELHADAGGFTSQDDVLAQIYEYPLEMTVLVDTSGNGGEFRLLLCTGGPAVRISGCFDEHREPTQAWLEYQDWGTYWQVYGLGKDDVLTFAQHFPFY